MQHGQSSTRPHTRAHDWEFRMQVQVLRVTSLKKLARP